MDALTGYASDDSLPSGATAPITPTTRTSAGTQTQSPVACNKVHSGVPYGNNPRKFGLFPLDRIHPHFLAFGDRRSPPQPSQSNSPQQPVSPDRNLPIPPTQEEESVIGSGCTCLVHEATESPLTQCFADVDTLDPEVSDEVYPPTSRIHASYRLKQLEKAEGINEGNAVHRDGGYKPVTEEPALAVMPDGRIGVVSVVLGSRNNAKGLVRVSGADADAGSTIAEPEVIERKMQRVEANATALMQSRLREHTRNSKDMVMLNYPVGHPSHQSPSLITQKSPQKYQERSVDRTARVPASVGGTFATPAGVTEKTYVDLISFEDELHDGNRRVCLAHQRDADTKRPRRLTESEAAADGNFGPWRPYEEAAPVEAAIVPNWKPKPKLPVLEKNMYKMIAQADLAFPSCAPDVAVGRNKVAFQDGYPVTSFDGVVVSRFHRTVDPNAPPSRSWVLPPRHVRMAAPDDYKSFLPKKEVHTYVGHTMAVHAIRYIPRTGHCLLSASMDGFVKIWDAHNNRSCLRTYKGHCKGVRDISFANAYGTKFYSCGFDSRVILWDTEYGKVLGVYEQEALPYCVTVYPKDEGIFIIGGSNRKACQFDARTGQKSLEYNAHMSNVNTVTFFNDDRSLMTTGDDRQIVIWEYNLPVAVKHLSDPSMHSIPAVAAHPSDKFMLAQAMSNQILVYEASGSRFRLFGAKRFKGHLCTGYAIRPTCSPDGRFVASGDARGRVYLWDWLSCRNLVTLEGHKSVTVDCQWHPQQPSRLATCSWDGTIKLWD
ncbi:G- beta WD-40 repeat containing protein [Babesia ovata]|uniref:Pre-mRNA-processing factor 17 n=1 Tax=Babesia ovata TaxID=189622 RepID=A0A2H6K7V8_9APIC|nr:G- beta WD-40 repeat containing protein [Babesia ovata]GBE59081.1 G- beta WD-40 repeat containing protein [Babesia ovata]